MDSVSVSKPEIIELGPIEIRRECFIGIIRGEDVLEIIFAKGSIESHYVRDRKIMNEVINDYNKLKADNLL